MRKFAGAPGAVSDALAAFGAKIAANAQALADNASATAQAIAALGTPVRADAAQSLTAAMIAQVLANLGVTYLIGPAGYINLFRLLILQWGSSSGSGGTGQWVFPTSFPSGTFFAIGTASGAAQGVGLATSTYTASYITYFATGAASAANYNGPVRWFAIGN